MAAYRSRKYPRKPIIMLNEGSSKYTEIESIAQREAPVPKELQEVQNLREAIETIMDIARIERPNNQQQQPIVAQFVGKLRYPSAEAFEQIEPTFKKYGVHAYFSIDESGQSDNQMITVIQGRYNPKPRPWWPNAVLLVLTLLSLLFVGSLIQAGSDGRELTETTDYFRLWEGLPYALSLILILGAHELGHYFAARYHNVAVTLPYFIPMPFTFFGTLGAFIQLREPMKNRKVLFDVGVAGPLAGLFFTIPVLFLGLATSNVETTPTDEDIIREGNSIFYVAAKYVVFGEFLPDEGDNRDIMMNQLAQAGWTGLFITALNLIPLGQLDGGHVVYTLFGHRARQLYYPILGFFLFLIVFFNATVWILWTFLLFLLGRFYARPLEDITPLDNRRRLIGVITLVIFVLLFTPNPIEIIEATG